MSIISILCVKDCNTSYAFKVYRCKMLLHIFQHNDEMRRMMRRRGVASHEQNCPEFRIKNVLAHKVTCTLSIAHIN